MTTQTRWDVFISHASEDKDVIARSLALALSATGVSVWFDEFTLTAGDSLSKSIDYGLSNSKYGIVIVSPKFLEKRWPQRELAGLFAKEDQDKVIIPVWHDVTEELVRSHSPVLADRFALKSTMTLEELVRNLLRAMNLPFGRSDVAGMWGEALTTDLTLAAEVKIHYDLYAPSAGPAPLLLALHGYGSNKGWMMLEARGHAPEEFAVASLQGPHQHLKEPRESGGPLRTGFGWLTNFRPEESVALHHGALLRLIDGLVARGVARRDQIFLMGFSQSCALNYRFAFTHREALRGVIGICGGLPGDWETNPAYGETRASVLHLSGTLDEFYPPERVASYAGQLRQRARDMETRAYDAAHEFVPEMRADVRAWLAARV